jgi:hypothetical protein
MLQPMAGYFKDPMTIAMMNRLPDTYDKMARDQMVQAADPN